MAASYQSLIDTAIDPIFSAFDNSARPNVHKLKGDLRQKVSEIAIEHISKHPIKETVVPFMQFLLLKQVNRLNCFRFKTNLGAPKRQATHIKK